MTLDVQDTATLERILAQPRDMRQISADRFGYSTFIEIAADAYEEAPAQGRKKIAEFINDLYGWMLYDPDYAPAPTWSPALWKNYHRFHRPGALDMALRIHNMILNRLLESNRSIGVIFTAALLSCVTLFLVFIPLWPFPSACLSLNRWLDARFGPVIPSDWF